MCIRDSLRFDFVFLSSSLIVFFAIALTKVVETLNSIGIELDPPKASLYVWAPVPAGYDSASFTSLLLDEADIVVTPGNGYGPSGEGYIRLSLTINDVDMARGLDRLKSLEIPKK